MREWLVLPENLTKGTEQIRQAVREEFGETLGTAALNACIKEVRDAVKPPRPQGNGHRSGISFASPNADASDVQRSVHELMVMAVGAQAAPVREVVRVIKAAMETCGIEAIRITADGKVDVTLKT